MMNYLLAVTPSSPLVSDIAQYLDSAQDHSAQSMDEQAAARTLRQMIADAGAERVNGRGGRSIAAQNRALEARRAAAVRGELISAGVTTRIDCSGFSVMGSQGPSGDDYYQWRGEQDWSQMRPLAPGGDAGRFEPISVWA